MLILKQLRFKGIGRYVDEQVIDFTTLGKFIQVNGKIGDTLRSSGAGKSLIFMTLDYLFGVNNRPANVLKSRYSDDGIFVEGTFEWDGKKAVVTRGKKFSVDIDGVITVGSASKTEEELDKIIGMDRQLFRRLYHKRQKEGGFFLEMGPKDTDDFLMSSLNLTHLKAKIGILDKKYADLDAAKKQNVTSLTAARSALSATQDAVLALGLPPIKEVSQATILELKQKSDLSASNWSAISTRHTVESEGLELSRPKVQISVFDRTEMDRLQVESDNNTKTQQKILAAEKERETHLKLEISKTTSEIARLDRLIKSGETAVTKIQEIAEHLKQIKAGKCYVCGQDWQDGQKEAKLKQDALKYRQDMLDGKASEPLITPLREKLTLLETEQKAPKQENPVLKELIKKSEEISIAWNDLKAQEKSHSDTQTAKAREVQAQFATLQQEMRLRHSQEGDQARGQADVDRMALSAAMGKLKAYDDARIRYEKSMETLKSQEQASNDKVSELALKSTQLHNELEIVEELGRALKAYISRKFDDALETISDNATKLIRHIPNMANATIQLEGQKETQAGKIKEEVTATIHMDGEENIDIRSLCGGERTTLDLAIDLAVIDLLETKANKGIDCFILDEPFEGLDTACIEMALEVLKNSSSNKRLIIVDHNPEVKEMVESSIVAYRVGQTSRIEQA